MISNLLLDSVVNSEIGAIALSEHGMVEVHVDLNNDRIKQVTEDVLRILNSNLRAAVLYNWDDIKLFPPFEGTRQGC